MAFLKRKISARRKQLREQTSAEFFQTASRILSIDIIISSLILFVFAAAAIVILSLDTSYENMRWKTAAEIISIAAIVVMVCLAVASYIYHYQRLIITNYMRGTALAGLFISLLMITKVGFFFPGWIYLATGTAVTSAMILTISYNPRFALGLSFFYAVLACLAADRIAGVELFLTMMAGITACSFSLKDIRNRMKLLEVSTIASVAVFATATAIGFIQKSPAEQVFFNAGSAAAITIAVGLIIQALLPVIEKAFRIATSMTLLDYSDADQPLLRKLAIEAPGTYSHSLLIGSIAQTAADVIGANGLLCRVGAYYHDIGKINKPSYFIENQMGGSSRHQQLSPAMSQLVIVGHVKDGVEMAGEYRLPIVLRQFIETHHGTTLIEYFYKVAKKKQGDKPGPPPGETEFRYPGPRPKTKEGAIVMLADSIEGAVRALPEKSPAKIETVVHNVAMRRLQDGQFDECDLTLRELNRIETSLSRSLAAHYHERVVYPQPEQPDAARQDNQQIQTQQSI